MEEDEMNAIVIIPVYQPELVYEVSDNGNLECCS